VLIWGVGGDDVLSLGGGLAATTSVKLDGGPGSDRIMGGPNSDTLFAGESGSDNLSGGGGPDALVARGGGGDTLDGGADNDNLVSDNPCDGHLYIGGPGGADVAGFGHVTTGGVEATLNGQATLRGSRGCHPTRILRSEALEGSVGPDLLVGTPRADLLIGREGNDVLIGRGGEDDFRGDAGSDSCSGTGVRSGC
jgi:Ca2+-binding RTX toxin-like protein